MKIKAEQKFIRISPRKIRLVADLIRHLKPREALDQLAVIRKKATLPLEKTLKSAIANATNNFKLDKSQLIIKEIQVGEGSTYKRWQPVSRGRAHKILKRTSHIRIILETKDPELKDKPKLKSKSKPKKRKESDGTKS